MTILSRWKSPIILTLSLVRAERDEKWTIFLGSNGDVRDVSLGRGMLARRWYISFENSSVSSELANRVKVCSTAASLLCSPRHKVVMDEVGRAIEVGMNSENSNTNFRSVGMDNMSR